MATKLKNLKISAVALCKQGCNMDAHVKLYKSLDYSKGGTQTMTFEEFLKSLPAEQQELVRNEIETAKAICPDCGNKMSGESCKCGFTVEKAKCNKKDLEKALEDLKAVNTELAKFKKPEENPDEVLKSLPVEVQKMFKEMAEKASKAEEIAKAMQEEKINKQFEEKASIYKCIPVEQKELATVLKSISSLGEDTLEKVEGILKSAEEIIAKGEMFRQHGSSAAGSDDNTSAIAQLDAAVEVCAKEHKINKSEAYVKVLEERPELYKAYVDELKGGK